MTPRERLVVFVLVGTLILLVKVRSLCWNVGQCTNDECCFQFRCLSLSEKNEECNPMNYTYFPYFRSCPCEPGLSCIFTLAGFRCRRP